MTSILSLPEELLVVIFEQLLSEGDPFEAHNNRMAIASLSRGFRSIVDNTPTIWTSICSKQSPTATNLALTRSLNLPLNIAFNTRGVSLSKEALAYESFELACLHIHRWRSAWLVFGVEEGRWFPKHLGSRAPLLEYISIRHTGDGINLSEAFLAGQTNRLTSVVLGNVQIPWTSGMLRGLHELDLRDLTDSLIPRFMDLMRALASSPKLCKLSLVNIAFSNILPLQQATIPLPQLRSLTLVRIDSRFAERLLRYIKAPACETLSVDCNMDEGVGPPSFLSRLRPFIPVTLSKRAWAEINLEEESVEYSVTSYPEGRDLVSIRLDKFASRTCLRHIIANISPRLRNLETHVILEGQKNIEDLKAVLTAAGATRVVALTLSACLHQPYVEAVLQLLTQQRESSIPWLFSSLQYLSFNTETVPPESLIQMIKLRYGRWAEEGMPRPVKLSSLVVSGATPQHDTASQLARAVLGEDAVVFEWKD